MTREEIAKELYYDENEDGGIWEDVPRYIADRYRELASEIMRESEDDDS